MKNRMSLNDMKYFIKSIHSDNDKKNAKKVFRDYKKAGGKLTYSQIIRGDYK